MISFKSLLGYWRDKTQYWLDLFKNGSRVASYSLRMVNQSISHYPVGHLTHLMKLDIPA